MDTVEFEDFNVEEGLHITVNLKDFKVLPSQVEMPECGANRRYFRLSSTTPIQ